MVTIVTHYTEHDGRCHTACKRSSGKMETAPRSDPAHTLQYDRRVGELRHSLRDCEEKRLELENKLFQYSSSDVCHLKYTKLKHSLKEFCEKEKKARLRNQAFLQEFQRIEARLHGLISTASTVKQKQKMLQVSRQAEINTGADMSGRMYHPATIFMGRQMSANSSIEHCLTQRKSPQPTKSFSISDPHSVRQAAINSNVTDSRVVPANSDIQCLNKPDKIDGKTSFQISQKMPVTSVASSEDAGTHGAEIDKTQSGKKHLLESKQSAQLSAHSLGRLSPENRAGDLRNDSPSNKVEESLMYESLVPNEERFTHTSPSGSSPDACDYINKQTSDKHSACENLSENDLEQNPVIHNEDDHEFLDSSSDLTVSITDSDMSSDDPLEVINDKSQTVTITKYKKDPLCEGSKDVNFNFRGNIDSGEDSTSISTISRHILSDKGFLHLLQSVEEMIIQMEPDSSAIYQSSNLCQAKQDHVTSLCNRMKTLNVEDLETCFALVLHELQRPVKSKLSGDTLSPKDHKNNTDEKTPRPLSKVVRDRLRDHISFVKEHHMFNEGDLPKSFSSVLLWNDKPHQDVLHMVEEGNNWSNDSSRETTSVSLRNEGNLHKPVPFENRTIQQGNAKVLKENRDTVNQDYPEEDNEEEISDVSELEIPGLTSSNDNFKLKANTALRSETSHSSGEKPPMPRKEHLIKIQGNTNSRMVSTNVKSKAFWGESEDSSSEIEAMLRPQTQHEDDFDDFFD
uniref:Centrosomal protein kizuna n=1 Tax=Leptobrachium leishanense TaxID=445787 RepID=A0A8C5PL55_9ANUR